MLKREVRVAQSDELTGILVVMLIVGALFGVFVTVMYTDFERVRSLEKSNVKKAVELTTGRVQYVGSTIYYIQKDHTQFVEYAPFGDVSISCLSGAAMVRDLPNGAWTCK